MENSAFIELSTKRNPIITEDFNGVLDNYELYLEERNNCKNYKLSFTIQPYMLYNKVSIIIFWIFVRKSLKRRESMDYYEKNFVCGIRRSTIY